MNIRDREMSTDLVSCVIPTYNRCPNSGEKTKYNPISWVADSLFQQPNVGEIIFIDDNSSDHFYETLNHIRKRAPQNVRVKSVRNYRTLGSGKSRNKGVELAVNRYIFFMDDDCIALCPNVLPNLQYAFEYLKSMGIPIGAINLPVLQEQLVVRTINASDISRVDIKKGMFQGGRLDKFPKHYLKKPGRYRMDYERKMWNPLEIDFVDGVFLTEKQTYQQAGGFPVTPWRNAAGEEHELSFELRNMGKKIFYLPSSKIENCIFHFRYGTCPYQGHSYPLTLNNVSFNEMVEESKKPNLLNNGNRVSKREGYYSFVLSTARLMFKYFGTENGFKNLDYFDRDSKYDSMKRSAFSIVLEDLADILSKERTISESTAYEIISRIRTIAV